MYNRRFTERYRGDVILYLVGILYRDYQCIDNIIILLLTYNIQKPSYKRDNEKYSEYLHYF